MAEILGLGCTHRPVMLRRNEDWTGMMRTSLDDPDMPQEMKDPARWPAQLREELGNDFGAARPGRRSSHGRTVLGTPGASLMTPASASPATARPANTLHRGFSITASMQP